MKFEASTFYWVFLLGAAPIELTLAWYQGWHTPNDELFYKPFGEGLLYIYAFITASETIFRLSHNEKSVKDNPHLRGNKLACLVIFLAFLVLYVAADRNVVVNKGHIGQFGQFMQGLLCIVAVTISYTTFRTTHKKSDRKPRIGKSKVV